MLFACTHEPQYKCITFYEPINARRIMEIKRFNSNKPINSIDTICYLGQTIIVRTMCDIDFN
jgi:hypothetical protein